MAGPAQCGPKEREILVDQLAARRRQLYRDLAKAGADTDAATIDDWRSQRILVIADGPLHMLPFAALIPGESEEPLGARLPITSAPSMTVYRQLAHSGSLPGQTGWVGFGNPDYGGTGAAVPPALSRLRVDALVPLPGSQREVEGIARLFGPAARTLLGGDASEEAVRALSRHTPLLHFACHGLLSSELPLDSALALSLPAADSGDLTTGGVHDGLLQAWEVIQDLRLDSDCVVLSACDTGVGRVLGGEGVMGFTRAFFHAGARSVLVSLWPIADESTAILMAQLYGRLRDGVRRDEALQQAQRHLMESEQHAHPFFWAAFQLHGRAD